ncbi:hypothetical protein QSV08_04115 [Maribacter sp. BPC-D8]|uniref:hypothetical protein n=1 Tax=Maribacter sp. BPC-D8 TaxID=3053613 RepID=UPI002B49AB4E|nr:hypothetical protein [Maribacter sp. BPC-D8]WRI30429.1 hypothetical protein QSV08_04115 [Maribacter sp. BPC-D8]
MNRILYILLIIGLYSCGVNHNTKKKTENVETKKSTTTLKDFEFLQDFEKNKTKFITDTIQLYDHSTDGGDLVIFQSNNFEYDVLDFWLYGETGKLNYTYWTKKNRNTEFKFVRQLAYDYDRPYYEENYKTDSTIYYLSYSDSKTRLFDINNSEIINPEQVVKIKLELETFFRDVTKGIEIIK